MAGFGAAVCEISEKWVLTKAGSQPIIQIISQTNAVKGTSNFWNERTESSRQMRGARITRDEYLPEQRPKQADGKEPGHP